MYCILWTTMVASVFPMNSEDCHAITPSHKSFQNSSTQQSIERYLLSVDVTGKSPNTNRANLAF